MLFLCFQTADVKMLVKCLQICADVFINCPQDQILVVHDFTRKRFCVVCALNCAQILVVRALDCAQFLLHPALFPT